MSLLKKFLDWFFPAPPQDETIIFPSLAQSTSVKQSKPGRKYDVIREAVEGRFNSLLREEIPEHREIAKDDVLQLHYVEIESTDTSADLLSQFFNDFNAVARKSWIKDILGQNGLVNLDFFSGIYSSGNLPEGGTRYKHKQILSQDKISEYSVHLYGPWIQPPIPPIIKPASHGSQLTLTIHDAQGKRREQLEHYPIKIGKNNNCTLLVDGRYMSREHCTLYSEGGQIWLEDHSTHGTWLDRKKVSTTTRTLINTNYCQIKLGKDVGEPKNFPEIELEIKRMGDSVTDNCNLTPVITAITPIAEPLLAALAIEVKTGAGVKQYEIAHLPFSIGCENCDYIVTPPGGVSRKHLQILAITDSGADVLNKNTNGTSLNNVLQPEQFTWPFDTEIILAPNWRKDPVRITLKRLE